MQSDHLYKHMYGGLQGLTRITPGRSGSCPHDSLVVQKMIRILWHGGLQGLTRIIPGVGKERCMSTWYFRCTGNDKGHMVWRTAGSDKDHTRSGKGKVHVHMVFPLYTKR